jgi:hypothetical protein
MKMWRGALFFWLLVGCSPAMPPNTEFVLTKGMVITATNPAGQVTITGGGGTGRIFSGPGWRKQRSLIPRDERWYGSLGLYDPGESMSPYGRLLADEGRLFFDSESQALRALYPEGGYEQYVFNNRGLVVGYHVEKIPGGEPTRSVTIWQIYIRGRRPTTLRGADDEAVKMTGGTIPETAQPHEAAVGLPITLGDKEYVPAKAERR